MACECCQQYAPRPHDGSPQPECRGERDLEEAREVARKWKAKAMGVRAAVVDMLRDPLLPDSYREAVQAVQNMLILTERQP